MEAVIWLFFLLLLGGLAYMAITGMRRVPSGMIGLQTRHLPGPQARRYGRVAIGGAGPQAEVLKGNGYYFRPRLLYSIEYVPQACVPTGTIGIVNAIAGRMPPPGTTLAPFTECDYFQDGAAFLRNGGYKGPQMQVLPAGHYDINPHVFQVITVDNVRDYPALGLTPGDLRDTEINVGETGVVITHLGTPEGLGEAGVARHAPGHHNFQYPWLFLENGGQLGVQSQTLPAGGYYTLNPWFAHVVKIPTRNLVLEWSKDAKAEYNFDASLEQIELDVQGFTVRLNMKQTLRIPEEAAPRLVGRFGDLGRRQGQAHQRTPVQQFVEKELATIPTTYFRRISARWQILEFITKFDELGMELSREVSDALALQGITAVTTSLEEYTCEPDVMNQLRRDIATERHKKAVLVAELDNSELEVQIGKKRLEVDAAHRELELVVIKGMVELLGPAQVATERILEKWAMMGMPSTLAIGGANDELAQTILQAMPFTQARDMLLAMASESGRQLHMADAQHALDPAHEDGAR